MIVVTGAFGFIGSNLVKELLKRDYGKILGVDFEYRPYIKNTNTQFSYTLADVFYENISKYEKTYGKIEAVFHEGAISSTTETNWNKLLHKNISCSLDLIYYCRDNNISLQYASSASVYGNPSKEQWLSKDKPTNPLNLYAKSKNFVDGASSGILNSKKTPKLLQGMRYFNVYGENEDHKGDQASPYHKFQKQLNETGKIKLFEGSENFYRDFISVEQVIDFKLKTFEEKPSGIYDVGTGNPKSFYDVAVEICKKNSVDVNKSIEYVNMPDNIKEHYQAYSCAIIN